MKVVSLLIGLTITTAVYAQPEVDFEGFLELSREAHDYRKDRLVDLPTFVEMSGDSATVILDTRSKAAYNDIHIKGAVHLNLSDFTEQKLEKVLSDKNTRILIYCNNNFASRISSLQSKLAPAALNIPTFITLYTYGYRNVYELDALIPSDDNSLSFTVSPSLMYFTEQFQTRFPGDALESLGVNPKRFNLDVGSVDRQYEFSGSD